MSWDLLILDWPTEFETLDDFSSDYVPGPLGARGEIIAKLKAGLPGIDLSDPSWGLLSDDTWSIELNIGSEDPCRSMMLHVRGGDGAIGGIARILEATGFRAYDIQASKVFRAGAHAEASFAAWRGYRNVVVETLSASTPE